MWTIVPEPRTRQVLDFTVRDMQTDQVLGQFYITETMWQAAYEILRQLAPYSPDVTLRTLSAEVQRLQGIIEIQHQTIDTLQADQPHGKTE